MKKNLLILLSLIVVNTISCGNLKDSYTDNPNNKQKFKNEFDCNIKNHENYQTNIRQKTTHEKNQEQDIDTQIKNLRTRNMQLSAALGAILGGSIAIGITAICFPPAVPFVTAKAGTAIVAATTTVTFSTVLPGAIATGATLGAAGSMAASYRD